MGRIHPCEHPCEWILLPILGVFFHSDDMGPPHGTHGSWGPVILETSSIHIWWFPEIGVAPNHPVSMGFSIINHPFGGTPMTQETSIFPFGIFMISFAGKTARP